MESVKDDHSKEWELSQSIYILNARFTYHGQMVQGNFELIYLMYQSLTLLSIRITGSNNR